jgi:hypothetical protein
MATSSSTDQRPLPAEPGDGEHVSVRSARQGMLGRRIFWILAVSLVLVVLAFTAAYLTSPSDTASVDGGAARTTDAAAADTFDLPPPAAKVNESD